MSNVSLDFLNNAVLLDDDELDELFTQTLHVDPPAVLVSNIMHAVSLLPQPKALSTWSGFDFFFVNDDADQLS